MMSRHGSMDDVRDFEMDVNQYWAMIRPQTTVVIKYVGKIHVPILAKCILTEGTIKYSIVHEIEHLDLKLLVRELFMCFEVKWIVHVSSH